MGIQEPKFWIQRCLQPGSSRKNNMGSFYRSHFPESMHKLKPSDIRQAENYLERAFSDDVNFTAFLPMIEESCEVHIITEGSFKVVFSLSYVRWFEFMHAFWEMTPIEASHAIFSCCCQAGVVSES